jgi:hypothetical protein
MAGEQASTTRPSTSGVFFEVERFEWAGDERLELAGRWYGLRGHRFVRPVLVVDADDGPRRMLALLDHKPWAAEDGEPWFAAFPWEGAPLEGTRAELAVAPSVAVELPAPAVPGTARRRGRGRGRADEIAALRAQLAAEQQTVRRLAAELDDARAADADRADLERERDAALAERDQARVALERAREAVNAAREEVRTRAGLDHDAVRGERDAAVRGERDAAVRARAAAQHERDEALDQRAVSDWERKAALAERDAALAERDRALEAHRAAVADLEALERRGQAPAREPAPADAAPPRRTRELRAGVVWLQRLVAIVVLVVWALVVYKVLQGVV